MSPSEPAISVVIATRNRAESLRTTLAGLVAAWHPDVPSEVVVVDNGSTDHTPDVIEEFRGRLPLRALHEAKPGKGACLNRAIDEDSLAPLVAILDDDMSPEESWMEGVAAISERSPDCDFFTGRSHVIWPAGPLPAWVQAPWIRSWAFSVYDAGPERDSPFPKGRWPSGNHFWFRSRVLQEGHRFENTWLTEPLFILNLQARGRRGVAGPDARAGHRIQPELLRRDVLLDRAKRVGAEFAVLRLRCGRVTRQGALLRHCPARFYTACRLGLAYWSVVGLLTHIRPSKFRLAHVLHVTERTSAYSAYLRHAPAAHALWHSAGPDGD